MNPAVQLASLDENDMFTVSYSKIDRIFSHSQKHAHELITLYVYICMMEATNDHSTSVLKIHHALKGLWSFRKIKETAQQLIDLKIIREK